MAKKAAKATTAKSSFTVKAYPGDAKTLLAFNLDKSGTKNLAGFTVQYQAPGKQPVYLQNELRFQTPANHAQDPKEPPVSSINAPIHKFRWVHVPGMVHQGLKPAFGKYTYTVTPRYFDDSQKLQPLDRSLSKTISVNVGPFKKSGVQLGFARGYVQSQAFVHHFGAKAKIRPATKDLLFDTSVESGKNAGGETFTFQQEYEWLGFTARQRIFDILTEVQKNKGLRLDMFAYDLNEPDVLKVLLSLAKQGRIRIILDDAPLHHDAKAPAKGKGPKPEDQFTKLFIAAAKGKKNAAIKRGHYNRFAHDKVLLVRKTNGAPVKVLTGSTNFSVTGIYVNSNHVIVFNDPVVAKQYADVFEAVWAADVKAGAFQKQKALAGEGFPFKSAKTPQTEISYAPHKDDVATKILTGITGRIQQEKKKRGSILFAVMATTKGTGPVLPALEELHKDDTTFTYGISDTPSGVFLYKPGTKGGLLVTGKPGKPQLPPPFDQVPGVGLGHQIHHKFVVCGFNRPDAVVYCGSSNLALGGEKSNGDNLLAIHDQDIATAFAIEAIALVDHFNFLDRFAKAPAAPKQAKKTKKPPALKQQAAAAAQWFLTTNDKWTAPYYDTKDLHCVDRLLFA
jgi:phosphatidylserine/phosphatidylglycerophosphate/cardiolipin synthase-like enzyme